MDEMNITSAQYVADEGVNTCIKATIDGVEMFVPINDMGNRHYAEIMRQVDAGTLTIADAE
jgi:hypothetical protein